MSMFLLNVKFVLSNMIILQNVSSQVIHYKSLNFIHSRLYTILMVNWFTSN